MAHNEREFPMFLAALNRKREYKKRSAAVLAKDNQNGYNI